MKERLYVDIRGKKEGFSLIELVIVVAIMAVLIGMVALAVIPYLERTRENKDQQTVDTIYGAFSSIIALEQVHFDKDRTFKITNSGITDEFSEDYPNFKDSITKALGAVDDASLIATTYQKLDSERALNPQNPDADAEQDAIKCILKKDGEITVVVGEIKSSNRAISKQTP